MSLSLEDAEQLKEIIVQPMVDAIRAELTPVAVKTKEHDDRLARLEGNQKKALLGYAGVVAVVTVAFNYVKSKYLSKLFS